MIRSLSGLIRTVIKGAITFYKFNRKRTDKVINERDFFRYKNLHTDFNFRNWWESQPSGKRKEFEKYFESFVASLDRMEVS